MPDKPDQISEKQKHHAAAPGQKQTCEQYNPFQDLHFVSFDARFLFSAFVFDPSIADHNQSCQQIECTGIRILEKSAKTPGLPELLFQSRKWQCQNPGQYHKAADVCDIACCFLSGFIRKLHEKQIAKRQWQHFDHAHKSHCPIDCIKTGNTEP